MPTTGVQIHQPLTLQTVLVDQGSHQESCPDRGADDHRHSDVDLQSRRVRSPLVGGRAETHVVEAIGRRLDLTGRSVRKAR
jgi:hypothetical protein